jgi:hypothetical protein
MIIDEVMINAYCFPAVMLGIVIFLEALRWLIKLVDWLLPKDSPATTASVENIPEVSEVE